MSLIIIIERFHLYFFNRIKNMNIFTCHLFSLIAYLLENWSLTTANYRHLQICSSKVDTHISLIEFRSNSRCAIYSVFSVISLVHYFRQETRLGVSASHRIVRRHNIKSWTRFQFFFFLNLASKGSWSKSDLASGASGLPECDPFYRIIRNFRLSSLKRLILSYFSA